MKIPPSLGMKRCYKFYHHDRIDKVYIQQMGQEPAQVKVRRSMLEHCGEYQMNPQLAEYKRTLPSYFAPVSERIIQELTHVLARLPHHPLEHYFTYAIDTRFHRPAARSAATQPSGPQGLWYQLENQERFLNLLNLFARQYAVQQLIQVTYQNPQIGFGTLRSAIDPVVTPQLNEQLIIRMLVGYFLKLVKTYANSGEKHLVRFYEETGEQLCLMILKGHIGMAQLYGLFYQFVYMDKHPSEVTSTLSAINSSYYGRCLRTQYSINVEKRELDRLRVAARLYLDQLYLSSLREAEDPEIKFSDDSLSPIRVFPISRVKDKPRG